MPTSIEVRVRIAAPALHGPGPAVLIAVVAGRSGTGNPMRSRATDHPQDQERHMTKYPPLDLATISLARGGHSDPAQGVCIMEAVALLAGEDFGDHPACVSPTIAAFL